MKYKEYYINALSREIVLRKEYIANEPIETIYFGGGTPSQLDTNDFRKIFDTITRHFDISSCKEITLEANPDDMTPSYVASLRNFPFNRISMGVQSFQEKDLQFLNRRHNKQQALQAVDLCKENGFTNISIDLIYGLPGQTPEEWDSNLEEAISLEIPHISAYHLIYEEGTALYKLLKRGKISPVSDELSVAFFSTLIDKLTNAGYLHYEISNFALPGKLSQHNSSYWNGKKYLGLGPSAHSFNGENRQWNVSSLSRYLKGIESATPETETELLDINTRYNDYIITRLRTMWGIELSYIQKMFGSDRATYCLRQATLHLKQGVLIQNKDHITLSREGIFISDGIMSDLLWVD